MQIADCYVEAIEKVVAWDLPEARLRRLPVFRASHLAGLDSLSCRGKNSH
jgi:hypothetical protein